MTGVGARAMRRHRSRALPVVILAAATAAVLAGPTRAQDFSGSILGSGINANLSGTFQRDGNWKIVALPDGFAPPDSQSLGYDAYVPRTVSVNWLGGNTGTNGSQGGYTVSGTTYHWICPAPDVTTMSTVLAPVSTGTPSTWYTWIAAQTFTVPASDDYFLNFPSAVDNRLGFFINGSIDSTNPRQPTITGGFQVGVTSTATGQFATITNNTSGTTVFLASGTTHTAYMVLTDLGNATGVLIGPSEFSTIPLPEPSTYALAMVGAGALALTARRRRYRRG